MANVAGIVAEAARLYQEDKLAEAEALYRQLHTLDPRNADLLRILGIIARRMDRLEEAIDLHQQSIRRDERSALGHFELGTTYIKAGREDLALPCFVRAIELDPAMQPAYVNAGAILEHQGKFSEAESYCRESVRLAPNCPIAHYNLGNVLREQADLAAAQQEFETAIRLDPDNAKAHWNLAFCLLATGRFDVGWQEYDWREAAGEVNFDLHPQPLWRGEPLEGKTILVHAEQGVGDEILFANCFPDIIERAGRVIIGCDPRLQPIFARSFPRASVHAWTRRKDWAPLTVDEPVDYQIPAGSLPRYFRTTAESFPVRHGFLQADPQKVDFWRKRYAALGDGFKIGISWQAGGQPIERRKRSTDLRQWAEIFATPGVQFINLQYGERSSELIDAYRDLGVRIHDWDDCDPLVDMDTFAAKLAALDLVISVGNATVHMAGALGVTAWTLLPRVPSWRWMATGEQSPWYATVQLLRQPTPGDWDSVFRKVAQMLRDKLGAAPPAQRPARRGLAFDTQGAVTLVSNQAPATAPIAAPVTAPTPKPAPAIESPSFLRTSGIPETFNAAVAAYNRGDYATAESLCREILDHTPRHHHACHLLGMTALQTRRPDLAVRSFRRAIAIDPNQAELYNNLAEALRALGKLQEAIESSLQAVSMRPDHVESLYQLGNLMLQWGKPEEAARCHLHAIQLNSEFVKAYNGLGAARIEMKQYDDAISAFRIATSLQPNNFAAWNNLGQALQLANELDDAITCYRQALNLAPDCFPAVMNLASVYATLGQTEAARLCYQRAIEIKPSNAEARQRLSQLGAMPAPAPAEPAPQSNVFHRVGPRAPHFASAEPLLEFQVSDDVVGLS